MKRLVFAFVMLVAFCPAFADGSGLPPKPPSITIAASIGSSTSIWSSVLIWLTSHL